MNARTVIDLDGLDAVIAVLSDRGYEVIGPQVRDGAIVYDRLQAAADLPAGWGDEQDGGSYRLVRRGDGACFGYAVGPHSWKRFLYPAAAPVFTVAREDGVLRVRGAEPEPRRFAFIGVRACELAAIRIPPRAMR